MKLAITSNFSPFFFGDKVFQGKILGGRLNPPSPPGQAPAGNFQEKGAHLDHYLAIGSTFCLCQQKEAREQKKWITFTFLFLFSGDSRIGFPLHHDRVILKDEASRQSKGHFRDPVAKRPGADAGRETVALVHKGQRVHEDLRLIAPAVVSVVVAAQEMEFFTTYTDDAKSSRHSGQSPGKSVKVLWVDYNFSNVVM